METAEPIEDEGLKPWNITVEPAKRDWMSVISWVFSMAVLGLIVWILVLFVQWIYSFSNHPIFGIKGAKGGAHGELPPGIHCCDQCQKQFKCKKRQQGCAKVRKFEHRPAQLGPIPIEIAHTSKAMCCSTVVRSKSHHFCSYTCYRSFGNKA